MKTLFDKEGHLSKNRPDIFRFLEIAIHHLHEAISKIEERLEKLDIALRTKLVVFDHHPTFVTTRSDVEEIRSKMGSYLSLTVAYPDSGKFFPVGAIYAADLRKPTLGTVSLRDFCNPDEMTIPSYLAVISVIDHHKSELNTFTPPMALIADVQSCNTLVAGCAFAINDRYSLAGQTLEKIDEQIRKATDSHRILQRLLKRREAAALCNASFYVHPDRETLEYLHFLYAILDDTDLLSKTSAADLECRRPFEPAQNFGLEERDRGRRPQRSTARQELSEEGCSEDLAERRYVFSLQEGLHLQRKRGRAEP
jgi:hypothetical protein